MDNASNEDGFVIERSDDLGATWNPVGAPTAADVTAFSDTTVAAVSTYQYRVYAFNATGNSAPSNVAEVTTPDVPPAAPSDLADNRLSRQRRSTWPGRTTLATKTGLSSSAAAMPVQRGARSVKPLPVSLHSATPPLYPAAATCTGCTPSMPMATRRQPSVPRSTFQTSYLLIPQTWSPPRSPRRRSIWPGRINPITKTGSELNAATMAVRPGTQVGSTAANVAIFSDTGLTPATSYMYRVYAFNTVGDSANPAGPIAVTTTTGLPPAAPSNPVVTNQTQSSLTLGWMDNSGNEAGLHRPDRDGQELHPEFQVRQCRCRCNLVPVHPAGPEHQVLLAGASFQRCRSFSMVCRNFR